MVLTLDGNPEIDSLVQIDLGYLFISREERIIIFDRLVFSHTCATQSELPSNVITMSRAVWSSASAQGCE